LSQTALVGFLPVLSGVLFDRRYMRELLDPSELQRRMELYVRDEKARSGSETQFQRAARSFALR